MILFEIIQSYVPRKFGLDKLIQEILISKTPLKAVTENNLFVPREIFHLWAHRKTAQEIAYMINQYPRNDINLIPRIALDYLLTNSDYTKIKEKKLIDAFGVQEYHLLDVEKNAHNTSFTLAIFSEDYRENQERENQYPKSQTGNYEHIKSYVISMDSKIYLIVIRGEKEKGLLKAGRQKIRFVPHDDAAELLGRDSISPFILEECFENFDGVIIGNTLLNRGYSQPHYGIVIDRKSALVVSDLRDLYDFLNVCDGYPKVKIFKNE